MPLPSRVLQYSKRVGSGKEEEEEEEVEVEEKGWHKYEILHVKHFTH